MEINHRGENISLPDSVRVVNDGDKIKRFDKKTGKQIPGYVAWHINPLDNYTPVLPAVRKQFVSQHGSKWGWVDQNGVRVTPDGRLYRQSFNSTYIRNRLFKKGESGHPGNIPRADRIMTLLYETMAEQPQFKHLFDEGKRPRPLTIKDVYRGFWTMLLNQDDAAAAFVKQLFHEYFRDPMSTMERLERIFGEKSAFTILNQGEQGQFIQVNWMQPELAATAPAIQGGTGEDEA